MYVNAVTTVEDTTVILLNEYPVKVFRVGDRLKIMARKFPNLFVNLIVQYRLNTTNGNFKEAIDASMTKQIREYKGCKEVKFG